MSARLICTLSVGPYPLEVYEHDTPIEDGDPQGMLDRTTRPIAIRYHARCKGTERLAVIIHELTHLAFYLHSLELAEDTEEQACDATACVFPQALPLIMRYLGDLP